MRRGLSLRLDRLWREYRRRVAEREADRTAARQEAEHRRAFAATLQAGLAHAGIDPAGVPALRRCQAEAAAACAAPPPPPSPPSSGGDALAWLQGKLQRIAERHRERPLDLATATPIELFAVYCCAPQPPGLPGYPGAPGG